MARKPSFYHHLHQPWFPRREARFRYTFGLGGISLFLCIILGITGVLEMFYYIPSWEEANRSLQLIELFVPYGRIVRSLHYWSAQALVVVALLHLFRVLFTGSYKAQRRFNWLLGLSTFVLILFFDFTGYTLRWDVDISWALVVGTNLLKSIPWIGSGLYQMVVGGGEINAATVVRLYAWHVYGLTIVAAFVIGWHIFRVRRDGGISSLETPDTDHPKVSRDELVWREAIAAVVVFVFLIAVSAFFPPSLGPAPNFDDFQSEAVAPWFFIWIQQLLQYGSPLLMGICLPLGVLLILILVPYLFDRSQDGVARWFNQEGRIARMIVLGVFFFIMLFTLKGVLG
jgi:quinol-cytochrome oxidoreductase complex cytochrome b subunit